MKPIDNWLHTIGKGAGDGLHNAYSGWRRGWRGKIYQRQPTDPSSTDCQAPAGPSDTNLSVKTISDLVDVYLASGSYAKLGVTTKKSYDLYLDKIIHKFGMQPIEMLDERGTRSAIRKWRDEVLSSTPRTADATIGVFRMLLNFAVDEEYIYRNPAADLGRIHTLTRRDVIWSDAQISTFLSEAPRHLARVLLLAIWTGQRQSDLLCLEWSSYDGKYIRIQQRKSSGRQPGRRVRILVSSELRDVLAEIKAEQIKRSKHVDEEKRVARPDIILTTARGLPWKRGFRSAWRKAVVSAGISGVTFHDLRGTFITLAHRSGSSIREIAEASGHYETECERTIRHHYLASGAEKVIERLEMSNQFASPKWKSVAEHGNGRFGEQVRLTWPRYPKISIVNSQST